MKITKVLVSNHRRAFRVSVRGRTYEMPFAAVTPRPHPGDRVREAYPDPEIGNEGFTFVLESGAEGTVHLDDVREYAGDPALLRESLLYGLTLEALRAAQESPLGKRALARLLRTSLSQVSRLFDPANHSKSPEQMIALLRLLGREVEVSVRRRGEAYDPPRPILHGYGEAPIGRGSEALLVRESSAGPPPRGRKGSPGRGRRGTRAP